MIQNAPLTADITFPLGADRDAESAARGNRSDNPLCVGEEVNPETEENDPSLSHSAADSCLIKTAENLPSGLQALVKMMMWFFWMNASDFSEVLNGAGYENMFSTSIIKK